MPTDVERLIVSLEARTKSFESALNKANGTAQKRLRDIERQFERTNKKLTLNFGGGVGGLAGGLGAIVGATGANELKKYADAWTEAGNKIKATAAATGLQARSLGDLNKLASQSRSGITETVDLYTKLLRSTAGVAKSEMEVARATDIVNKAFKAGGAAASEQSAGILQLSQALGSGVLQGDELRSIRENAPLLAKAIADEFGTSIAGLKALGAEGALTSERVFKAILKAGPQIERQFATTTATIGDGFVALNNAVTEFVGRLNEATGASGEVGETLSDLATIVNGLADAFVAITGSSAGKFLGFLNDVAQKLNPAKEVLKLLAQAADEKNRAKLTALVTPDTAKQVQEVTDAMNAFFDARDEGAKGGFLTKEQGAGFEKLRDQIKSMTISAEDASKEVRRLVELDPGTSTQIIDQFDLMIERLQEVANKAAEAAGSISSIFEGGRAGGFAFKSASDKNNAGANKLFDDQETEAAKLERAREIDAKTKEIMEKAEKAGIALTEAAARIEAIKVLGISNTTSEIEKFRNQVIGAESGGDTNAKNPNSSATGLGQFITSTWIRLFKEHFPDRAEGMTNAAIAALRTDAETSKALIDAYAAENAAVLQKAGLSVDAAALHLAHFLGAGGAVKILQADPKASAESVLGSQAANANPTIIGNGHTVEDVIGYAQKRAGMTTALTQENDLRTEQQKLIRDTMAALAEETATIGFETQAMSMSNAEREKARVIRETLLELEKQGITITDEIRAAVEAEAQARYGQVAAYDAAGAAADALKQRQQDLLDQQQEINDAFAGAMKSFISDLAHGKSLTEALTNAVGRLADRLLDIALDNIFSSLGGGGAGGGIGGLLGGLLGFAGGGYTGNGGTQQAAGVVHGKEFVVNARATKKNRAMLEAMNAGVPGYARGGYVERISSGRRGGGRSDGGVGGDQGRTNSGRPNVNITVYTPDAPSFLESQNQIANKTAATLERTMRTQ